MIWIAQSGYPIKSLLIIFMETPIQFYTQPVVSESSLSLSSMRIQRLNNLAVDKIIQGKYLIQTNNPEGTHDPASRQHSYSVKLRKSVDYQQELQSKLKELRVEISQLKHLSSKEMKKNTGTSVDTEEKMREIRKQQLRGRQSINQRKNKQLERQSSIQEQQALATSMFKEQSLQQRRQSIAERLKQLSQNRIQREQQNEETNQRAKGILKRQREERLLADPYVVREEQESLRVIQERQSKYKPMDFSTFSEHQQRVREYLRLKGEEWKHQSQSLRKSIPEHKIFYESKHKKDQQRQERERAEMKERVELLKKEKIRKVREYGEKVKDQYKPEINPKLESEIVRRIRQEEEKLKSIEKKKEQSDRLGRVKGEKYLEQLKSLPKKLLKKTSATEITDKTDERSTPYINYLVHSERGKDYNRWSDFHIFENESRSGREMNSDLDRMKSRSERVEQELRRKEEGHRLIRKKSEEELGRMDEEYYEMMKAKLSLLGMK